MRLTFDTRLEPDDHAEPWGTIILEFHDRQRPRALMLEHLGEEVRFELPRGAVLRSGDLLKAREDGRLVRIQAKPEPVLTVRGHAPFELLRAAYHLGNRHVPVELRPELLRLEPDSVLADMLKQMGLHVDEEVAPFEPEAGAYHGHGHSHSHDHSHEHSHAH
jgi:urease accessory protein